jgi:hypothetical protein
MQEQMRLDEQERRKLTREERTGSNLSQQQGSQEGYWSYMQRQVQERTEKLNVAGDQMERLEENSSNWARDVNKYVQTQKRKAVLGGKSMVTSSLARIRLTKTIALGSKFGL